MYKKFFKAILISALSLNSFGGIPVNAEELPSEVVLDEDSEDEIYEDNSIDLEKVNDSASDVSEETVQVETENSAVKAVEESESANSNITYVDNVAEFAEAIAIDPTENENRIMVPSSIDVPAVLDDLDYSAVAYDDVYVIDFENSSDKDTAVEQLTDAAGEENVSQEITFYLDSDEDFGSEIDLAKEEKAAEEAENVKNEGLSNEADLTETNGDSQKIEAEEPESNGEYAEMPEEELEPSLAELDFDSLRERAEREERPIIAVIDTGITGSGADEAVDLTDSGSTEDFNGHGTKMIRIIRDQVGDGALILSIKAFDGEGRSTSSTMFAAVKYAMEAGANIINISASANDSKDAAAFKSAVLQAISVGVTVVGSVGNSGIDAAHRIPANIDGVIGVTTVDDAGKVITGNYGIYTDYGVPVASTSEATAIVSGMIAAETLKENLGINVFEIDSEGEIADYPIDEESEWKVDCSNVLYVRTAVQQANGSYVAGSYATTNGLANGGQIATFRVYGARPTWWEDANTNESSGGINSSGRTWFYMDNEGAGAYDTHSPEFNHIAGSHPYYGNSQYSIYHNWAKGVILGNFTIDSVNVTNSNYKYLGYHIEYYASDDQLGGCSNSMTEAQAEARANTTNSFFYKNAYNVGSPAMTFGSPTALKTGSANASFSKSAGAGGHVGENSTTFRHSNSWKRIHVTLVFALKTEPLTYTLTKVFAGDSGLTANRPSSVVFHIKGSDGSTRNETISVSQSGTSFSKTITLNSKTAAGAAITYKVWETAVTNYTSPNTSEATATTFNSSRVATITNTLSMGTYRITKNWSDSGYASARPSSITLHIKGSDGKTYNEVLAISASGTSFTKEVKLLNRNASGGEITYKVWETVPPNYTSDAYSEATAKPLNYNSSSKIYTAAISNTLQTAKYRITKTWSDSGYASARPASITLHIKGSDGSTKTETLAISTSGTSFTKDVTLPTKTKTGAAITYKVWEDVPPNYTSDAYSEATAKTLTYNSSSSMYVATIANTLQTAKYRIIKKWVEGPGYEVNRPASITLHIKGSDGSTKTETLATSGTGTEYTKEVTLPTKTKTGANITYKVWEDVPAKYTADAVSEATAKTLTYDSASSTYKAQITNISTDKYRVVKIWSLDGGQKYHRPASIKVYIKGSDGTSLSRTLTINQDTDEFSTEVVLPTNTANGDPITYKAWEDVPADYTSANNSESTGATMVYDAAKGAYIANITNELNENGKYRVTKVWTNDEIWLPERPSSITLHIKGSDGQDHVEVLEVDTSTTQFTKEVSLPQRTADGTPITYKVWEEKPNNYTTDNGSEETAVDLVFNASTRTYNAGLSNKFETAKYQIIKVWADDEGDEDSRPSSVTLHLKGSDGTLRNITLPTNSSRTEFPTDVYTLPSKSRTQGPITYTVWEDPIDDYTTENYDEDTAAELVYDSAKDVFIARVTNSLVRDFPIVKTVTDAAGTDINEKTVSVGANLYYHITFTNPYSTVRRFDIYDELPQYTEFVSADNDGALDSGAVKWSLMIQPKSEFTVSFVVKTTEPNVVIPNIASGTVFKPNGIDPALEKETNEVVNYTPGITKDVKSAANVSIDTKSVEPGRIIHYEIKVDNPAPVAKNYTITDVLDTDNLDFISADKGGVNTNGTVKWTDISVPAEGSETVTIYAKVRENENVEIKNKATSTVEIASIESNEVVNWKGIIKINKAITNYYDEFGTPFFDFVIRDEEGHEWYRHIELSDEIRSGVSENFYVPLGIPAEGGTFTIHETRNARYKISNVTAGTNMAVADNVGTTTISSTKPLGVVNFEDTISIWSKLTHAAAAVNEFH